MVSSALVPWEIIRFLGPLGHLIPLVCVSLGSFGSLGSLADEEKSRTSSRGIKISLRDPEDSHKVSRDHAYCAAYLFKSWGDDNSLR